MNFSEHIEKLCSFISRDNITLILAVFGSFGTLINWISSFISNRRNLDIRIVGYRQDAPHALLLYMSFMNNSRLPISISDISIEIEGVRHSCQKIPITALEEEIRRNGHSLFHYVHKTMEFPISISGLNGTSGYAYFSFPEATLQSGATRLNFLISTNRGKAIETSLELGRHLD